MIAKVFNSLYWSERSINRRDGNMFSCCENKSKLAQRASDSIGFIGSRLKLLPNEYGL